MRRAHSARKDQSAKPPPACAKKPNVKKPLVFASYFLSAGSNHSKGRCSLAFIEEGQEYSGVVHSLQLPDGEQS